MEKKYLSESAIRKTVLSAFQAKAQEKNKPWDPAVTETEAYKAWVNDRIEDVRADGRLLTEAQYEDHVANRLLREGDIVTYIGPDRVETTSSGRFIPRAHGQRGVITRIEVRQSDGARVLTFQPEITSAMRALDEGEVVLLTTLDWWLFERARD